MRSSPGTCSCASGRASTTNTCRPTTGRTSIWSTPTARASPRSAEDGPVFEGKTYPLDLLIYATGFEVQKTGIYNEIRGEDGREINETYADGIRTLLGVHTHGYPEPVHHGRLPGLVPVQPDLHAAGAGRPHRRVHQACARAWLRRHRRDAGDRGVVGAGGDHPSRQDQPQRRTARPAITTSKASSTAARTATTTAASTRTANTSMR